MKRLAFATFSRAEYAASLALMRACARRPDLEPLLIVGGSHLDQQEDGIERIRADGLAVADTAPYLVRREGGAASALSLANATTALAGCLERLAPEILVICGDRYELLAAAGAALLLAVPVAHISGGEITEGALDEQVRHAVTKLSHLHFVAMFEFRQRLLRMGEEPWRVHATGDPALDILTSAPRADRAEIADALGLPLTPPVVIVAIHPTTRAGNDATNETEATLTACIGHPGTLILTGANADPGAATINRQLEEFARGRSNTVFRPHLGHHLFHGLLANADALLGNSSSGIWEAPSFSLPVVNVGDRQLGRTRGPNVIDVRPEAIAIRSALDRALSRSFRQSLSGMTNPYGDGNAAARIVTILQTSEGGGRLLRKRFNDG